MSNAIELRDVGPIERLEIPVPDGGGVVVLKGVNGSGKSHALSAVSALVGSGAKPTTRDGSIGAQIEGLGARLTVGRRSTVHGELEVSALDGEDPSRLVDPGIKAQDAADAERVRALLRLSRATVDASAFANLVGGDGRLRELCRESSLEIKDVPSMAAAIKRDFESAARKAEQTAQNLAAKASGVAATLKELHGDGPREVRCASSAEATAAWKAAIEHQSALEATREQQGKLRRSGSEAAAALEQIGDDGTEEAQQKAQSQIDLLCQHAQEMRAKVDRLVAELAEARGGLELLEGEKRQAEQRLEQHRRAAKQRESLARAIEAAAGARDVSGAEVIEAAQSVEAARAEVEAWVIRDKTQHLREQIEKLELDSLSATNDGDELRHAARGTEGIVLDAVRTVCGEGMELRDGRLHVRTDRGLELFSDLSHGERWRIALDIAVKAVGSRGVLVVRQEAWEALDPVNRREVAEHARALGVVVLTAEADEGAIRAEVVNASRRSDAADIPY